jgi:hypothetical protein
VSYTPYKGDSLIQDGQKIYVSKNGSDTNGNGSLNAPFLTISKAVSAINNTILLNGHNKFNLIIGGGVYRETINLPASKLRGTEIPIVVQAAPGEAVLVKGSDVKTGFQSLGGGLYVVPHCIKTSKSVFNCMATEQVYVGGRQLQQHEGWVYNRRDMYLGGVPNVWRTKLTGGLSAMGPNTFYHDIDNEKLYLKLDPAPAILPTVEVSTREHVFITDGINNITLRNMNFEHSSTTSMKAHAHGSVWIFNSDRVVVENVAIIAMDGAGIQMTGYANNTYVIKRDITVKNCNISYNGQFGMTGNGERFTVINNLITHNNTRGFENIWAAGGIKFAGAGGIYNSIVANNKFGYNYTPGFWCDYCYYGGNSFTGN